jgi:hypothetical protein
VLFDRMCRENGISHRLTAPRTPTTTGKIERFHQSVRKEFLADQTFPTLTAAQEALDAWVHDYNNERPHQALEMAVPADRFRLVPETRDPSSVPVFSEEDQKGQWCSDVSAQTASSRSTLRCFPSATPTRANSWTPSSTTPRSRCGTRTTSSRPSLG